MIDRRKDHKLIARKVKCPVEECRAGKGRKCKGLTNAVHIIRKEAYVQLFQGSKVVVAVD